MMEKRTIEQRILMNTLPKIPKMIINMLPDTPEHLLKYAERVKKIIYSPSIEDETIKKLMKAHLLTDEEYLKTFFYIMALTFYKKKPVNKPKINLIVAQTGSGKSHLTAKILREDDNFVFIDSDKYKHFRSDAKKIAYEYQTLYPFLTGPDAYDHADNLYNYAIKNGYNVIKEIAPSPNKDLMKLKTNKRYKISVLILAVGNINSILSTHERYELQITNGLKTAKLTPIIRHNESYNALLDNVRQLIDNNFNELYVYTRGKAENDYNPVKIFPSSDYRNPIQAIEATRLYDNNNAKEYYINRLKLIIDNMQKRNAPKENYDQIEKTKKYIKEQIAKI